MVMSYRPYHYVILLHQTFISAKGPSGLPGLANLWVRLSDFDGFLFLIGQLFIRGVSAYLIYIVCMVRLTDGTFTPPQRSVSFLIPILKAAEAKFSCSLNNV